MHQVGMYGSVRGRSCKAACLTRKMVEENDIEAHSSQISPHALLKERFVQRLLQKSYIAFAMERILAPSPLQ